MSSMLNQLLRSDGCRFMSDPGAIRSMLVGFSLSVMATAIAAGPALLFRTNDGAKVCVSAQRFAAGVVYTRSKGAFHAGERARSASSAAPPHAIEPLPSVAGSIAGRRDRAIKLLLAKKNGQAGVQDSASVSSPAIPDKGGPSENTELLSTANKQPDSVAETGRTQDGKEKVVSRRQTSNPVNGDTNVDDWQAALENYDSSARTNSSPHGGSSGMAASANSAPAADMPTFPLRVTTHRHQWAAAPNAVAPNPATSEPNDTNGQGVDSGMGVP